MKQLMFFLLFITSLKAQTFTVINDTISLEIQGFVKPDSNLQLTHAIKLKNVFYCLFQERGQYNFFQNSKYLFAISEKGIIVENILLPEAVQQTVYLDLFLWKDKIYLKEYSDYYSYEFETSTSKWRTIEEIDDIVYEDDNFYVTFLDFGEWGNTTWFKDKLTKKEYELSFPGETINRIGDSYYITLNSEIIYIPNPTLLSSAKIKYDAVKYKKRKHHEGSQSIRGFKSLYKNLNYNYFNREPLIPNILTSFVYNENLYHLVTDQNSTFIANIVDNKINPIQSIGTNYPVFNYHYAYRNRIQNNSFQLLKFQSENAFGLIEISENKIHILNFKHDLKVSQELAKDSFGVLLDFLDNNLLDGLKIQSIDSIENKIGATDLKIYDRWEIDRGYYPNDNNYDIKGNKIFFKAIDSTISNITQYYYSKEDFKVKVAFAEWFETKKTKVDFLDFFKNDVAKIVSFQNKKLELERLLNYKYGLPINEDSSQNFKLWKSKNGFSIKLYTSDFENYREIRLIAFAQ